MVNKYWVKFSETPCQLLSFGVVFRGDTDLDEVARGIGVPDGRVEVITEAQYDQLGAMHIRFQRRPGIQ